MKSLRNALTRALNVLAGVSFIAMVVLTCWQVFTRYVLKILPPGRRNWSPTCLPGPACWARPWSPGNGAT